ncbi:MAG: EamA family transporter [Clostridia bacterium]|nr:EamA family transporter [Clostridia bacterium]
MKQDARYARLSYILSMIIYGTIGLVRRWLPVSSSFLAMSRGLIGVLFLLLYRKVRGQHMDMARLRPHLLPLILSGAIMGFNWVLLFEAYNYTTVAVATLCYYMAPVFLTLISPFLFHEKLTPARCVCILLALVGMVFLSGVLEQQETSPDHVKGILMGLAAAVLYACVVCLSKKAKGPDPMDKTLVQLAASFIVVLPYTLLTGGFSDLSFTPQVVTLLLVAGIVHTGIAYLLYFSSMDRLDAQVIAIYSYLDPVTAVILSCTLLGESLSMFGVIGAFLILSSTFLGDAWDRRRNSATN